MVANTEGGQGINPPPNKDNTMPEATPIPHTKRLADGRYIVLVECSSCGCRQIVNFAGWSGLLCRPSVGGCGAELERGQYRVNL